MFRRPGRRALWLGTVTIVVLAAATLLAPVAANAGGGCHIEQMTVASGTAAELSQNCITPTVLQVDAGERVTWVNKDGVEHTVTGVGEGWGSYTSVRPGKAVSYRFTEAGVFPYFCYLHPGMVGSVVVGDGLASGSSFDAVSVEPVSLEDTAPTTAAPQAATASRTGSGTSGAWPVSAAAIGVAGLGLGLAVGSRRRPTG